MSEAEKIVIEGAEKKTVKKVKKVKKVKAAKGELPDFTKVKVKKTTKVKKATESEENAGLYAYDELLDTVFKLCNNEQKEATKHIEIPKILLAREGSKRIIWQNFAEICRLLNRNPEDVRVFVTDELLAQGTMDSQGGLTLKAKLQSSGIENVILRYASLFVQCPVCKSLNTSLIKENRIQFVHCNDCSSHNSVSYTKSVAEN